MLVYDDMFEETKAIRKMQEEKRKEDELMESQYRGFAVDYIPGEDEWDDFQDVKFATPHQVGSCRHTIMNSISGYSLVDFVTEYNIYLDDVSRNIDKSCLYHVRFPENMGAFTDRIIPTVEAVKAINDLDSFGYCVSKIFRLEGSSLYVIAEDENAMYCIEKKLSCDLKFVFLDGESLVNAMNRRISENANGMPVSYIPYDFRRYDD